MSGFSIYLLHAFLISLAVMRPLMRVAKRFRLMDRPDRRKAHETATPVVGGIVIFLAFVATALQLDVTTAACLAMLPGLGILLATGVADDRNGMSAWVKFAGQTTAVALLILLTGTTLPDLTELLGLGRGAAALWPHIEVVVTIVFAVGVINALNLIDGLDGLAGGIALVASGWLAVVAAGQADETGLMLALFTAFSVLGFLVYNIRHPWRPRAEVFMGDSGSMLLGALLTMLMLRLAAQPLAGSPAAAAGTGVADLLPALVWIVALPLIDMTSLFVRRLARGRSPFIADRNHIHHLLTDNGVPIARATFLLIGVSAALGGVGVAGIWFDVPPAVMLWGLVLPAIGHTWFVFMGWHVLANRRARQESLVQKSAS